MNIFFLFFCALFSLKTGCSFNVDSFVSFSEDSVEPSGTLKATIVYIHGESYEWNSGNPYDGSVLAAEGNVILVTINFRLGVLGNPSFTITNASIK